MGSERKQIAKMYKEGMPVGSIAKKLNESYSKVENTIRSLLSRGECADRDVVDWQNEMYEQGCGVIPGRQVGEMPYVEKKKLEDYPLVVVRGKTYRDVTDSLYYSTRYKSIYLSDKEKEKRKEREKEDEIRLREKMREREQEEGELIE
ncbi:MAG: helix-turn-helix domain-containing protein [Epulopiscium sp.]|nr:helix-turn-helix domain-containing protein [Candidatus Epulonipiscium sp.]